MVNLFDITRGAGNGSGLDAISRQFGLDPAQTMKAVEAVLPAFSLAFQRMAMNPAEFADFLSAVGSGRYTSFYDAFNPAQASANGGAVLNQLFKSPEAAGEVARQAASLAGVGSRTLQAMMPILAAQIAGGMARYATAEGFADLLRQWAGALKAASDRIDPPRPQDPWSAWQQAAGTLMGVQPTRAPRPQSKMTPDPAEAMNAWMDMVGAMMGQPSPPPEASRPRQPPSGATSKTAGTAAPNPEAADPPRPDKGSQAAPRAGQAGMDATPDPAAEANPFETLSHMFETGREVQAQHLAAFQSILDEVWGPLKKT